MLMNFASDYLDANPYTPSFDGFISYVYTVDVDLKYNDRTIKMLRKIYDMTSMKRDVDAMCIKYKDSLSVAYKEQYEQLCGSHATTRAKKPNK